MSKELRNSSSSQPNLNHHRGPEMNLNNNKTKKRGVETATNTMSSSILSRYQSTRSTNANGNTNTSSSSNRPSHRKNKSPFDKLIAEVKFGKKSLREDTLLEKPKGVIYPWDVRYKAWWGFSVFWSIMTVFFETYLIAFGETGFEEQEGALVLGWVFVAVFTVDIILNFNLAYFDENEDIVTNRRKIARKYLRLMFWVDFVGVFPFYNVAVAIAGEETSEETERFLPLLRLLRLLRLVRLHRVKQLFDALQFNTKVSLMTLTLVRNFGTALVWTHFAACIMYYISRQYEFDTDNTWIGAGHEGLSPTDRYLTALYWSVVTFTTVGYGDFSPVNAAEQVWGIAYMLMNMVLAAWMIGSITLLIVKTDELTGHYRDRLKILENYAQVHDFDRDLTKRLRSQVKLYFSHQQVNDEEVLKHFPTLTRRKVLKRLYLPCLVESNLMNGIREQFMDAFLSCCKVDIFSPGDELLQFGSISTELYLLVEGEVKLIPQNETADGGFLNENNALNHQIFASDRGVSVKNLSSSPRAPSKRIGHGQFINDVSFFTSTSMTETVQTLSICKTLTLSLVDFKMIAKDHPGSVARILQNLLDKLEEEEAELHELNEQEQEQEQEQRAKQVLIDDEHNHVEVEREPLVPSEGRTTNSTGKSVDFDIDEGIEDSSNNHRANQESTGGDNKKEQRSEVMVARHKLVKMHIHKLKDDQVASILFAASRGDTITISMMCDEGFDPDSSDYDGRTALMVAANNGSTEAVEKLLEYGANPNLVDVHGSTALYEAVRNGHDSTMDVIVAAGGELCMDDDKAASELCKAVVEGQTMIVRRLLRANIQVNASGFDKRRAVHVAAASGNLAALKILVEYGADLSVRDMWGHSMDDYANLSGSEHVIQYLRTQEGT